MVFRYMAEIQALRDLPLPTHCSVSRTRDLSPKYQGINLHLRYNVSIFYMANFRLLMIYSRFRIKRYRSNQTSRNINSVKSYKFQFLLIRSAQENFDILIIFCRLQYMFLQNYNNYSNMQQQLRRRPSKPRLHCQIAQICFWQRKPLKCGYDIIKLLWSKGFVFNFYFPQKL